MFSIRYICMCVCLFVRKSLASNSSIEVRKCAKTPPFLIIMEEIVNRRQNMAAGKMETKSKGIRRSYKKRRWKFHNNSNDTNCTYKFCVRSTQRNSMSFYICVSCGRAFFADVDFLFTLPRFIHVHARLEPYKNE